MKFLYTILFFANTVLLIALTFLFLKLLDKGIGGLTAVSILLAMALCVALLAYALSHYMKLPPSDNQ